MMLRTSLKPIEALYGEGATRADDGDPLAKEITEELKKGVFADKNGRYKLSDKWDKYASLVTSKNRDGAKFSPLFVYKPHLHLFIDTNLCKDIIE
jgi:hypothetical protein